MLGRALFALVCLVIVAGLALPLYPAGVGTPNSAADPVLLAGEPVTASCEDCPVASERDADCRVGKHLVQATFVAVEDDFSLSVTVLVRPHGALSSKLPAI